ncbi:MAG: hypothetical protein ACI4QA_06400 [Candidatus Spyradosoma sp.]
MPVISQRSRPRKDIFQFSIFAENKVGCLNRVLQRLHQDDVRILALSCIDQTDCAVLRIVPNYPEAAEIALKSAGMIFSKTPILAIRLRDGEDLAKVTRSLAQAEINIHYIYPFVCCPNAQSAVVLSCDAAELAERILSGFGVEIFDLDDFAR